MNKQDPIIITERDSFRNSCSSGIKIIVYCFSTVIIVCHLHRASWTIGRAIVSGTFWGTFTLILLVHTLIHDARSNVVLFKIDEQGIYYRGQGLIHWYNIDHVDITDDTGLSIIITYKQGSKVIFKKAGTREEINLAAYKFMIYVTKLSEAITYFSNNPNIIHSCAKEPGWISKIIISLLFK